MRLTGLDTVQGALDTIETYFENGWTDGLPVVPPTESAVADFVAASGQGWIGSPGFDAATHGCGYGGSGGNQRGDGGLSARVHAGRAGGGWRRPWTPCWTYGVCKRPAIRRHRW